MKQTCEDPVMTDDLSTRFDDLLNGYRDGVYTRGELFTRMVTAFDPTDFQALIDSLPVDLKTPFADWAAARFGDETSSEPVFILSQDRTVPEDAAREIRRWLDRQQ